MNDMGGGLLAFFFNYCLVSLMYGCGSHSRRELFIVPQDYKRQSHRETRKGIYLLVRVESSDIDNNYFFFFPRPSHASTRTQKDLYQTTISRTLH